MILGVSENPNSNDEHRSNPTGSYAKSLLLEWLHLQVQVQRHQQGVAEGRRPQVLALILQAGNIRRILCAAGKGKSLLPGLKNVSTAMF
ncbi:hypothetical protein Tco_1013635 [Tanacetum coccineum]